MLVSTDSKWLLKGKSCCFQGWCKLLGVGSKRAKLLRHRIVRGCHGPQPDLRRYNRGVISQKWLDVDAFLLHTYTNIAEPLPESDLRPLKDGAEIPRCAPIGDDGLVPLKDLIEANVCSDTKQLGIHACANTIPIDLKDPKNNSKLPEKHLGYMEWEDLYCIYKSWSKEESPASMYTFRRVFRNWESSLRFRKISQHARCSECARLCAERKQAKTEADYKKVQDAWEYHLRCCVAKPIG